MSHEPKQSPQHELQEELFLPLVSCLLSFGTNYEENVSKLLDLCAKRLSPKCISYRRMQNDGYEQIARCANGPEISCQEAFCAALAKDRDSDVVKLRPSAESSDDCLLHRIRVNEETKAYLCLRQAKEMGQLWGGNTFLGFVVSAFEAEERRQESILALQTSEEMFKAFFHSCCAGILVANGQTREFLYANRAICRFLGYSKEELLTLSVDNIHPRESVAYVISEFESQMRGEKLVAVDIPCLRKDGETVWADISSAIFNLDGKPCVIGSFSDTTEKKRLTDQLLEARKMEAIGRLAGGIAHGYNNVLCPVLGYAELGLNEVEKGSKIAHYLRLIHQAAKDSATLTRQLLSYGQKQVLKLTDVDLVAEARQTTDFLAKVIGEQVTVLFETSVRQALVEVDTSLFHQVLLNMAINAKEAMVADGLLTIKCSTVSFDEQSAKSHALERGGDYILLTVSDTGRGMDEETCRRVFEPFFTTKGVGEGTGLGLAMVQGILKQHGGSVEVQSQLGKGTTFTMYWPQAKSGSEKETAKEELSVADPASVTILVVEDDMVVRSLAQRMLEYRGYNVVLAEGGPQALELVEQGLEVTLLLTDVVMPEMSGKELYEKLSEDSPSLSVVYMSGYASEVLIERKVDKEASFFVQKPFTVQELLNTINSCLSQKK